MAGSGAVLEAIWRIDPRSEGICRPYSAGDVERLRGTRRVEYTFARAGAERLWKLLDSQPFLQVPGPLTGKEAVERVAAGLLAIHIGGRQVATGRNTAGQLDSDQCLDPADHVFSLVRSINESLECADRTAHSEGKMGTYWFAPLIARCQQGLGGTPDAFELVKRMIEAGAAGVWFEDQLSSANECLHMEETVVAPAGEFISSLVAARLAADVMGVPTLLFARTDAHRATLVGGDADECDKPFLTGERTIDGGCVFRGSLDAAIARGLAYAPYADVLWCETAAPDLDEARRFAEAVHKKFPGKLLAYGCSPSFGCQAQFTRTALERFQRELAAMGYRFQFIAGSGALPADQYPESGSLARPGLPARQLQAASDDGDRDVEHQRLGGTGYFDAVTQVITRAASSITAPKGPIEEEQFRYEGSEESCRTSEAANNAGG
jgi:isocitrate lyase